MAIRYSITYMDSHSGGGFRFFGFRKPKRAPHCGKCIVERAIIKMTNNDDEDDNIELCVSCYNTYDPAELLKGSDETSANEDSTN